MAIRKRGDSWQIDVCVKGVRKSDTRATEAEAKDREVTLRAELILAKPEADRPVMTIGAALDKAWELKWSGSKNAEAMAIMVRVLKRYWGADKDIAKISKEDVDTWVATMKRAGKAGGTINRHLSALGVPMGLALDYGYLTRRIKLPLEKEFSGRIRYLTREEEAKLKSLMVQFNAPEDAECVTVLVDTGLRCGELRRMQGRDIANGMVTNWINKGDRPRSIPLTPRALAIIEARMVKHPTGRLFPYRKDWLRRTWMASKVAMGLQDDDQFVPHALRHTFASRLVQAGIPILTVQKLMGHADIKQTMKYAHLAQGDLTGAIAALSKAM